MAGLTKRKTNKQTEKPANGNHERRSGSEEEYVNGGRGDKSLHTPPNKGKKGTKFNSAKKAASPKGRPKLEDTAESYFYGSSLQKEMGSTPPFHKKKRIWFIFGIMIGVLLAIIGVGTAPKYSQHLSFIRDYMAMVTADIDLKSLIPSNVMLDDILSDISDLLGNSDSTLVGDFEPARSLKEKDPRLSAKHPVVLIPGIISTGLESWSTANCSKPYFRQRMWGSMTMFKAMLLDKECWIRSIMLDPATGLDPPDIKLRAAQGLEAADYFISGYWIWAKLIENLAEIGYDNNNMHFASYDWRLSYADMEKRDGMMSNLKAHIENLVKASGQKAVIVGHSMGVNVFSYFMKWVESPDGGDGGDQWVDKHIEALVNIAGPMLGVSKTLSSLLSGEQRETVQPLADYLLEHFLNKQERAKIFRSWGGLPSLLPKGGNAIWGDSEGAPDDILNKKTTKPTSSLGSVIRFAANQSSFFQNNLTTDDALKLLDHNLDPLIRNRIRSEYSFGVFHTEKEMKAHKNDRRTWSNPLQSQLPNAPNMRIHSIYGVGVETERAYYYRQLSDEQMKSKEAGHDHEREKILNIKNKGTHFPFVRGVNAGDLLEDGPPSHEESQAVTALYIDSKQSNAEELTSSGVVATDGDGTVPLLSLGYMCVSGWRKKLYNPHGVKVVCKELEHNPTAFYTNLRGGFKASDHVTILGNYAMMEDVLKIASGFGNEIEDSFISKITKVAEKINIG
ncbi:phospholipid:diacylglycerol acyltransferase [Mycoemilia scoparia]|uniref:Phospholipid:diacylglycerol acyltransferase n=1 Tax=Mycoemilia scoparia TaxID=417184 RepID=A0A9W7ZWT3_9FUNG|nr:phospholipid:diacylglycerol acyltransferase [Mycoemilia scoparia]